MRALLVAVMMVVISLGVWGLNFVPITGTKIWHLFNICNRKSEKLWLFLNICHLFLPLTETKPSMAQERQVIHLQQGEEHHYFGSVAAIYDHFTKEEIGISYGSIRNYGLSPEKPYRNEKTGVIIRVGVLIAKEGNRGRKKEWRIRDADYRHPFLSPSWIVLRFPLCTTCYSSLLGVHSHTPQSHPHPLCQILDRLTKCC